MIRDAEVRRLARRARVEPRIIDLDYVLGWALYGLAAHPELHARLVFKGGTCLRKCYFPDYRFRKIWTLPSWARSSPTHSSVQFATLFNRP